MLRPRTSKQNKDDLQPVVAGHSSILQSISRFWLSMLVILVLLYAALLAIGRTDGFRNLVEQKIENMSGMGIMIDKAHIGFDLHVRLQNIRGMSPATNVVVALEVAKLVVRPVFLELLREDPWPVRSLVADRAIVRFYRDGETWQPMPALANALAPWMNAGGTNAPERSAEAIILDALLRKDVRISLTGARVMFMDGYDGEVPVALADGINFDTVNLQPFEERVLWSRIMIKTLQNNGTEWMSDLELEWIRQKDQDVILRIQKAPGAEATALPPAPSAESSSASPGF